VEEPRASAILRDDDGDGRHRRAMCVRPYGAKSQHDEAAPESLDKPGNGRIPAGKIQAGGTHTLAGEPCDIAGPLPCGPAKLQSLGTVTGQDERSQNGSAFGELRRPFQPSSASVVTCDSS